MVNQKEESPEELINRLVKWYENPDSDPDLERWYKNEYQRGEKFHKKDSTGKTND